MMKAQKSLNYSEAKRQSHHKEREKENQIMLEIIRAALEPPNSNKFNHWLHECFYSIDVGRKWHNSKLSFDHLRWWSVWFLKISAVKC